MKVWVTRTRPGADRTADRLRALGHDPIVAPVLATRALPWTPDLAGVGALAFTSINAVEAFARGSRERALPAFAVGAATAHAAEAAGFADVRPGAGDVAALADLILRHPAPGEVLHAAGRPRAGDLEAALRRAGVPARTVDLYETVPTGAPPPPGVDAILVHSPHAARVLSALEIPDATWLCISKAAAAPLRPSRRILIAARPDEAALLSLMTSGRQPD